MLGFTRWVLASAGVILVIIGSIRLHDGMRPLLAFAVAGLLAVIAEVLFSIAVLASENKKQEKGVVFWHSDDIFSSVGSTSTTREYPGEKSESRRVN